MREAEKVQQPVMNNRVYRAGTRSMLCFGSFFVVSLWSDMKWLRLYLIDLPNARLLSLFRTPHLFWSRSLNMVNVTNRSIINEMTKQYPKELTNIIVQQNYDLIYLMTKQTNIKITNIHFFSSKQFVEVLRWPLEVPGAVRTPRLRVGEGKIRRSSDSRIDVFIALFVLLRWVKYFVNDLYSLFIYNLLFGSCFELVWILETLTCISCVYSWDVILGKQWAKKKVWEQWNFENICICHCHLLNSCCRHMNAILLVA